MKPFLTKEQADWLLENIRKGRTEQLFGRNAYHEDTIMNTINQCTEKEFPEFVFNNSNGYGVYLHGAGDPLQIGINISYKPNAWHAVSLRPDEFKQFAEGVARIAKWLEEQE